MTFDLSTILTLLGAAVGAAIVILKVVAPRTKTTKDDKALEVLEATKPYLPAKGDAATPVATDAVGREPVRDHRVNAVLGSYKPEDKTTK